jgi:hypothetical protein
LQLKTFSLFQKGGSRTEITTNPNGSGGAKAEQVMGENLELGMKYIANTALGKMIAGYTGSNSLLSASPREG